MSWLEQLPTFVEHYGLITLFALYVAGGMGSPVNSDLLMFSAGIMAQQGLASSSLLILISFAGLMIGDTFLFRLAKRYGRNFLRVPPVCWFFSPHLLRKGNRLFKRFGDRMILVVRFIPGTRSASIMTAGVLALPSRTFLIFNGLALAVWTSTIHLAGFYLGAPFVQSLFG